MPKITPATEDDVLKVRQATEHLRKARDLLKAAGAKKAAQRCRLALHSAGGAARHVEHRAARSLDVRREVDMPERMRIRDNKGVAGPVVDRGDDYISIEYETTEIITRHPDAFEPAPSPLETSRMLVLSTAHITQETSQRLFDKCGDHLTYDDRDALPVVFLKGEYGYLLPLIGEDDDRERWAAIPDLAAIRTLAEANGCTWIMLDRDGEMVDELPSYDW